MREVYEGKCARHDGLDLEDTKALVRKYAEDIEAVAADLMTDNDTVGLEVSVKFYPEGPAVRA